MKQSKLLATILLTSLAMLSTAGCYRHHRHHYPPPPYSHQGPPPPDRR